MKRGARYEAASPLPLYPELLIDISGQQSKTLDRYLGEPFDKVIVVCDSAAEACPIFPGGATTAAMALS